MIALAILASLTLSPALPQDASPLPEVAVPDVVVEGAPPPSEGHVTLNCAVQTSGAIRDCRVVEETPRGQGFAQAALSAARRARLSDETVERAGAEGRVTFTTRFQLAEDAQAPRRP
jgi:TonB family protein